MSVAIASRNALAFPGSVNIALVPSSRLCGGVSLVIIAHPAAMD